MKKYAIINHTTVTKTGTLKQLFPNTCFSTNGPNTEFLLDNNLVDLIETLTYTVPTEKLTTVDPYINGNAVYNVKVEDTTTEEQTVLKNNKWEKVRTTRNELLAKTDWRASSDLTLSDEWKTYRQALRDIPTTQSDPYNITYPTPPS